MAKRFDNDFDAEGFVDQFRASDGSITSRIPLSTKEAEDSKTTTEEEKTDTASPKPTPKTRRERGSEQVSTEDYQAEFIENLKYRYPVGVWKSVKIHPDFTMKIQQLITVTQSHRTSFSSFINNVLEEHFRQHEKEFQKIINNEK